MPQERNAFKLGLTALTMLALFVAVLVFLAGHVGGQKQRVVVRFPDGTLLPPLANGSDVQFGGRIVGKVVGLTLHESPTGPSDVDASESRVYFDIALDVDRAIGLRRDCRITVASPIIGVIGTVLIKERGTASDLLPDDAVVTGEAPASIDQLTQQLVNVAGLVTRELDAANPDALMAHIKSQLDTADKHSLLAKIHRSFDDVNRITAQAATQLDPDQRETLLAKLHALLDNVNQATGALSMQLDADRDGVLLDKIHSALDVLNAGLTQATEMIRESRAPVRNALSSVEATARQLDQGIAKPIAEQLDAANPLGLLAKVHLAADGMNASLADLQAITGTTRQTIDLNVDRIDKAMLNIKEGSDHLRAGLKDLRLNPWRLLYTPTPSEAREDSIHRAAREFSEAATRLDDAVARLKALADSRRGTIRSDDPQLVEIRSVLTDTFRGFAEAERALWRELNID